MDTTVLFPFVKDWYETFSCDIPIVFYELIQNI